jgi:RNA polymerase subunit RPABC4/transcription elongation factor Spt4
MCKYVIEEYEKIPYETTCPRCRRKIQGYEYSLGYKDKNGRYVQVGYRQEEICDYCGYTKSVEEFFEEC